MCQVQSLFHHVRNDGGVSHHHNHRHRTTIFLLFYLQIFISITLLITLNDKIFVHCQQQQQQRAKSIESTTNESRSDPITSSSSSTIKWMPISINNDPTQQQSEQPYGFVKYSNQYGYQLPCQIGFHKVLLDTSSTSSSYIRSRDGHFFDNNNNNNNENIISKIYWEVRDERSLNDEQYVPVIDVSGIREQRSDGSLAFMPFGYEQSSSSSSSSLIDSKSSSTSNNNNNNNQISTINRNSAYTSIANELHNSLYRCVVEFNGGLGRIISRSIHVTVVFENNVGSSLSSSSVPSTTNIQPPTIHAYDTTVTDGNDALLKCTSTSDLYQVVAWITDDDDIILPFDYQYQFQQDMITTTTTTTTTTSGNYGSNPSQHFHHNGYTNFYIPADTRYYVLPSGELLIAAIRTNDLRRQFRCRMAHRLTGERYDSSNWARIKLRGKCYFDPKHYRRQLSGVDDFIAHHIKPLQSSTTQSTSWSSHYTITSRHLRINQPTIRDVGTYVCVANNSHFQVHHETDLLSKRLLHLNLTIMNHETHRSGSGPYSPGDIITLSCNITHLLTMFDLLPILPPSINEPNDDNDLDHNQIDDDLLSPSSSSSTTNLDPESIKQRRIKLLNQVLQSRFMITYYWYHNQVPISTTIDQNNNVFNSNNNNDNKYSRTNSGRSFSSNKLSSNDQKQRQQHYEILGHQRNVLRIYDLEYSDAGIYQCFARINGGPDFEQWLQSSTLITMYQSPPKLIQTFNEQILMNQQELSLKCMATGIPAPVIIWQRNQINLTDLDGNLINLQQTGSSSTSSSSTNNQHLYRYKTNTFQLKPTNFFTSQPSSSSSSSTIIKSEQQLLFQTVSYFNISSLRPQDVGQFRCLAINRAGSIGHQARIGIIGSPYVHPISDQTAVVGQQFSIQCAYSGYPIEEVYFVKSKRRLPFDERHIITQMGHLTITQIDKSDEDDYSCIVIGENGQRSQQTFHINTVLPPVLSPFIFSDALEEGTRATAVCSVISGDPPITLQWLKDGQPLLGSLTRSADPQIQVLNIKEFISSLIITNITRRHQGVYTCLATTPNTSSNRTAIMRVKAPPKWLIKPANKVAITQPTINPLIPLDNSMMMMSNHPNTMIRFDCLASGNPTPVIRWKFLRMKRLSSNNINVRNNNNGESSQIESVPILSSPQIHVLENGSLLIRSIDKTKFEGIYLCEVSNGVGKPLEARASLTIYQIPQIQVKVIPHGNDGIGGGSTGAHKLPSSSAQDHDQVIQMAIRHHSQVSLSCTGTGAIPIFVGWYKNGQEINVYDTSSITSTSSFRLFESPGSGTILSGKNHGKSTSSSSSSSIDKSKQFGERTTNLLLKHVGRSDTAQYVCLTRNSFGMTHRIIMLHVLESPDAPESLKAIEVGSRTVTLTWSIGYTGNLPLLSQNIEYKKEADKTWHNALMIKSNTNTVTVHGLQPLTPYEFRVSFVNELGTSEHSRSITLTTQMEAPTVMPDNIRAVPLSTHAIPTTTSDIEIIDGFYIGYRTISTSSLPETGSNIPGSKQSQSSSTTAGINNNNHHQSLSYTYKTISNTPIQPLYSKMSTIGNNNWKQSSSSYGIRAKSSPNSFLIKLNNQSTIETDQTSTSMMMISTSPFHQYYEHIIDTLQRQTLYQFIVQAFNEKGAGPSSIEVTARTFAHDPPRPPNFRIENVSTHEALLSWDYTSIISRDSLYLMSSSSSSSLLSSSSGSSLIGNGQDLQQQQDDNGPLIVDGYVISYHLAQNYVIDDNNIGTEDWQSITISSSSTSSFTLRNLRCGSEYVTRIEAFNEMGSGRPSEMIRFSTLGGPPIPPDKFANHFIISNITFVIINLDLWSDGGCPITGYSIKYRTRRHYHRSFLGSSNNNNNKNNGGWITLSTHLMPEKEKLIIRDLMPGTWHDLIIAAQNDAGKRESEYSFATLTETGATVEPLHAFESRMATNTGTAFTIVGALFDDPMIFIPAICTIIVLIVVISTSIFLYVMRMRQEALQIANEDTYCSHRSSTRLDEMSLSSYPNSNGTCKKSSLMNATKLNGKVHLSYEKNGMINNNTETEPLYEQTNFATSTGVNHQPLLNKAATFHKSPHHQRTVMKQSIGEANLLETIDLTSSTTPATTTTVNQHQHQQSSQDQDQSNESYSFEPIFDHRDPMIEQYFKTLQTRSYHHHQQQQQQHLNHSSNSSQSSHLYQMPEQVKQQQQQQANLIANLNSEIEMIDIIGDETCTIKKSAYHQPLSSITTTMTTNTTTKPCNAYMTTFGIVRPQQQQQGNVVNILQQQQLQQ
ncbi:hypothetical protein DERP_005789 [Dermatophagoides pteronyssinus]|uniref:Down syndrome cell adhesion molecule-like protein Dscam2 n=1 Tax=Dermatophagoides pteronyssinus TaxID=6956 RepID=A0ABQ8J9K7_DERPT|nr:hypothetical protein DERP_005789 [Dermatophagoides pteronyssinus]